MKYFKLFLFFYLSSQLNLIAQTSEKEFGKISKDEMELSEYAKDKSAEAVVLFDIGKSKFGRTSNSFEVIYEKTTRIKIFSEAGFESADVEIQYYQEGGIYEKVFGIEACTYNLENGILNKTILKPSNIHDEKINDYWNAKKFAMPNVKEGSIIEYKYKISSPYMFNLRDWEFQWKIPVIYSEYKVKMIPFYEYSYLLQGKNNFDYQNSYVDKGSYRQFGTYKFRDMVHEFVMNDVPAFNDEEFISSVNDYIIKIDFQLAKISYLSGETKEILTTWPDLIKEFAKDFGKYVKKSEKIASKIFDMGSIMEKEPLERFNYILDYVKHNFNWDNRNWRYASKSANDFFKDKYGNCADINLFTIGLLNASGIEAYPLLLSSRSNGKIQYDYPYFHFFNCILIKANVEDQMVLSDATGILSPNDRIPVRCLNDKGLVINEEEPEWINLQNTIYSERETSLFIDIKDSDLVADIKFSTTEYDALYHRNVYGENKEKIKEKLVENDYSIVDSSISILNQLSIKEPYILAYSITDKLDKKTDKIYLSPFINEIIKDNPLKQKTRTYPIDMIYPIKKWNKSTVNIPEGFKIDFVPTDYKINNELFELNYIVINEGDMMSVEFSYYFKNPVYSAKDYSRIKFYFSEIVKKGNEKIVLSKK